MCSTGADGGPDAGGSIRVRTLADTDYRRPGPTRLTRDEPGRPAPTAARATRRASRRQPGTETVDLDDLKARLAEHARAAERAAALRRAAEEAAAEQAAEPAGGRGVRRAGVEAREAAEALAEQHATAAREAHEARLAAEQVGGGADRGPS